MRKLSNEYIIRNDTTGVWLLPVFGNEAAAKDYAEKEGGAGTAFSIFQIAKVTQTAPPTKFSWKNL